MKYTLDTEIRFAIVLDRSKTEETQTIEEMGFTQEELETKSEEEIEKEIQEIYETWEQNYLDAGWAVVEN